MLFRSQGRDHPRLFSSGLVASAPHWIAGAPPGLPRAYTARTRHRQPDQPCRVESLSGGRLRVDFETPQRAMTPGQFVVFYDDAVCLGGATIEAVGNAFEGNAAIVHPLSA